MFLTTLIEPSVSSTTAAASFASMTSWDRSAASTSARVTRCWSSAPSRNCPRCTSRVGSLLTNASNQGDRTDSHVIANWRKTSSARATMPSAKDVDLLSRSERRAECNGHDKIECIELCQRPFA